MTLYITPINRTLRRHRYQGPEWSMESDVMVPVDVKAEADAFVIEALLPGINPEDIAIQVVNETVSIQGEFKPKRDEKDSYLLQEQPHGKFSRVLTLPYALDAANAEADVVNGVLTLRVPKAESARPKTIKVKTLN
jgi:HSP20 family protein